MTKLFGANGELSPTKLFGPGGKISDPPKILGPDGTPFRRDAPDAGFQVGHPITFSSLLSSGYRSYWHGQYDNAIRHNRDDALAMRNDCFLMSLLNERKFATTSLRWHIEVDDERDSLQRSVRDTLTRIVTAIPRFRRLCMYLLEAIWYGRYASEIVWEWKYRPMPSMRDPKVMENLRVLSVKSHQPINGDKIGHHWDGTPYILVNPAFDKRIVDAEIAPTTAGADGLYLRGHWRNHFIVHTHEAVDGDYFDPYAADGVHGFGIRSVLFWLDWIRKEWLGNVADWCERTGLGIRLWYFQANNPTSENAVKKAARESNDRTNIFIPRFGAQSGSGAEGVEFVDTSGTGADLLLRLQKHVEEMEERYIIGQSMSGGQDVGDGLGGTGRANFARDTKNQIVSYDAANLGETLTTDLVKVAQDWTYRHHQEARDVNARLVFNVDEPEPDKLLSAIKTFVLDLGGTVREDGVRSAIGKGFEKPQEGDDVISLETINKQKQAGMPQQPGMPGGMLGQPGGSGLEAMLGGAGEEAPQGPPGSEEVQAVDEGGDAQDADEDAVSKQIEELLGPKDNRINYAKDMVLRSAISRAEDRTETELTEQQKESGEYEKGYIELHGLGIRIETPKGAVRSGVDKDGKPWSIKMKNSYGYIESSEGWKASSGADGDHVDVFLGPVPESEIVFVIDQNKPDGTFDEHKCVIGVNSVADAKALYLANYEPGWDGFGGVKAMPIEVFKQWVREHRTKTRAEDQQLIYAKPFDETKHPRGQPGNKGQFVKKSSPPASSTSGHEVPKDTGAPKAKWNAASAKKKVASSPRFLDYAQKDPSHPVAKKIKQSAVHVAKKIQAFLDATGELRSKLAADTRESEESSKRYDDMMRLRLKHGIKTSLGEDIRDGANENYPDDLKAAFDRWSSSPHTPAMSSSERENAKAEMRKKFLELMRPESPIDFESTPLPRFTAKLPFVGVVSPPWNALGKHKVSENSLKASEQALADIKSLVASKGVAVRTHLFSEGLSTRAAIMDGYAIDVGVDWEDTSPLKVEMARKSLTHEYGHALEIQVPGLLEKAIEFLDYRLGDEKPTNLANVSKLYSGVLADLLPSMFAEFGRKDDFHKAFGKWGVVAPYYVGKTYRNMTGGINGTEVFSMGLEYLLDDPADFIEQDPEFAHFLIGALQ